MSIDVMNVLMHWPVNAVWFIPQRDFLLDDIYKTCYFLLLQLITIFSYDSGFIEVNK